MSLSDCQKKALAALNSSRNVFVTGVAGSGKSHLIRSFLSDRKSETSPILSSTGASALLVGGRTFHSFFGLGIFEGGVEATIQRALRNRKLKSRLKKAETVIIDEVSMLSGVTLQAAERVAREARKKDLPWGGLQVVAVGDFAQLPPVSTGPSGKTWAFLDPIWSLSGFESHQLRTVFRTKDPEFLDILNDIRVGNLSTRSRLFLESRHKGPDYDGVGTRLVPLRAGAEAYNLKKLAELPGDPHVFLTKYTGAENGIERCRRVSPVPDQLQLKVGALIMFRQNDLEERWVNGSMGWLREINEALLRVELLNGQSVWVKPTNFSLLDGEGEVVAVAENFPVNLAYAMTIHKAQGATLDSLVVDLGGLWEPGQAYVALSRVARGTDLSILRWNPRSFIADPEVLRFYSTIN